MNNRHALIALLLATGCGAELTPELTEAGVLAAPQRAHFRVGELTGEIPGLDVRVRGEADLTVFPGNNLSVDAYRSEEGRGAALALIDLWSPDHSNPLEAPFFWTLGNRAVFEDGVFVSGTDSAADLYVDATICGISQSSCDAGFLFDVDEPADQVIVTIHDADDPGTHVVTIEAIGRPGTLETRLLLSR